MVRQFVAARPLQASKLGAVSAVLAFGVLGFFRIVPGQQLTALLLVPLASIVLALVVAAETLIAGYRTVSDGRSATERVRARPGYTVVRTVEAAAAILTVAGIAGLITAIPDEPMSGPGAIGLLFVMVALGLLALAATLVRTAVEYYDYRRERAVGSRSS